MHSEEFAAVQNQLHRMEPWPGEPGKKAGLARARSGLDSVCGLSRLQKHPTSPFRSIGGYLNYAGWSDRQRFMDVDRLIQLHTHESQNTESVDASNDCPAESYPENADHGSPFRKRSCSASDYPDTKGQEDRTRPIFADVIKGFEDLPFRRL